MSELNLLLCPFCDADLEPFGPAQHNHPVNDCWLSTVKIEQHEYAAWNRRATQPASAPADEGERGHNLTDAQRAIVRKWMRGGVSAWEFVYAVTSPAAVAAPQGQAEPVAGDFVLVPRVPTEDMVVAGFESAPDPFFVPEHWEKFQQMSGCQQSAFKARLCYAAMIAAAPAQPTQAVERDAGKDWLVQNMLKAAAPILSYARMACQEAIGTRHGEAVFFDYFEREPSDVEWIAFYDAARRLSAAIASMTKEET